MYRSLMRLVQIFGAANPVIHKYLDYYGDAIGACEAIDSGECDFLDDEIKKKAEFASYRNIDKLYESCIKRGIKLVSIYDKDYPRLLREIYNPPSLLFYKGDLDCLNRPCITAVGAREITEYIKKLARRVCTDLSSAGITLVSGMANGVDNVAHSACINNNNPTVGVLACGMFYEYPRNSRFLRNDIINNGGAYISELLPNTSPTVEYFEIRNRIMAGLSGGTIFFQADEISGSLITARLAVQEGRDVYCVPPPDIFDSKYIGVVEMLRDGAIPLFNHDDVLNNM